MIVKKELFDNFLLSNYDRFFYKKKKKRSSCTHYFYNYTSFFQAKKQKQKFYIHFDNCPSYKAKWLSEYLTQKKFSIAPHLAYSPELSPSDFYLFGKLKDKHSVRFQLLSSCVWFCSFSLLLYFSYKFNVIGNGRSIMYTIVLSFRNNLQVSNPILIKKLFYFVHSSIDH